MSEAPCLLLPNLGAEEGSDWHALLHQSHARVAARLWSHLFSRETLLCTPASESAHEASCWRRQTCGELWPASLGPAPNEPTHAWLEAAGLAVPWLSTATLASTSQQIFDRALLAPQPSVVTSVHDKAFALEQARAAGLLPRALEPLIHVFDPSDLEDAGAWIARLERLVAAWPDWTLKRFTLKPRQGSSGRGRIGGTGSLDPEALRGALPRLARRGGVILEPWLERCSDLAACVYVPPPGDGDALPTLLGSLETLASASGVFRGHCGEVDSRGRVYSGHREDEEVRASAAWLAGRARERGFFGPCGVDAFSYLEGGHALEDSHEPDERHERLRPALEFNARASMGLVTLGLVRRALPRVREAIGLAPENRRAFLFTLLAGKDAEAAADRLLTAAGDTTLRIPLASERDHEGPIPMLFFGHDRGRLREAHRAVVGC